MEFHLKFAVMLREWTEMILDKTRASDAVRQELMVKCELYERRLRRAIAITGTLEQEEEGVPPLLQGERTLDSIIEDL